MKKITLRSAFAGLMILCSAQLGAQSMKSFPSAFAPGNAAQKAESLIPAPDTRDRGILMYGATLQDATGPLHYVKFYSKDAFDLIPIAPIDPKDDGYRLLNLRCGAWCGDKFLGYKVNIFTYTERAKEFCEVDFTTGEVKTVAPLDEADKNWPVLYEMTYDNTNDILYALGRNSEQVVSDLYTVDKATGKYTFKKTLDTYIWAMACDYEGNMYVVKGIPDENQEFYIGSKLCKLDPKKDFSEVESFELKCNGEPIVPNYSHTMDMNHNSNLLYWAASNNEGYQHLYEVDPKVKTTVETSSLGFNVISSLYVPYRGAANRDVAGKVTKLVANADDAYTLCDTLKWTNPSVNWRGDKLEELHSIQISRGTEDNVVATVEANGKIGQAMVWIDQSPEHGYNKYYLTPMRKSGEKGLVDSVRVYVGQDVPGAVGNLVCTPEGNMMKLTWEAPELGAAGKGYDKASLTYTVIRQPGNVEVVKGLKECTLVDTKDAPFGTYYYEVTPFNAQGEGITVNSDYMQFGAPYSPDYSDMFDNLESVLKWTAIDNDFSGHTFEYVDFRKAFSNFTKYMGANDDLLVSPPLQLNGGCSYRIIFYTELGSPDEVYTYSIVMGDKREAAAMTTEVATFADMNGMIYSEPRVNVGKTKVENDGVYYIALRDNSPESSDGHFLSVNGFMIERIYDNDLSAVGLGGALEMAQGTDVNVTVQVLNPGSKTQQAYKVRVLDVTDGEEVVIGEADCNLSVEPDEIVEAPVVVKPVKNGARKFVAVVEMNGDENAGNNRSAELDYEVQKEGTITWNVFAQDENRGAHTTVPISFLKPESTTEQLYLADEIKATGNGLITRFAFEYTSNGIANPVEDVPVKIYMALTDKTEYPEIPSISDWTSNTEMQLVYDGITRVDLGTSLKMEFTLDTPFQYEKDKNLLVQVWKSANTDEMFPALFQVYNKGVSVWRSLRYQGGEVFAFDEGTQTFAFREIPVAYMAIDYSIGISEELVLGGSGISYSSDTHSFEFRGVEAREVYVYDMLGKVCAHYTLGKGETSVQAQLQSGFYVVKAVTCDGENLVQKIVVDNE